MRSAIPIVLTAALLTGCQQAAAPSETRRDPPAASAAVVSRPTPTPAPTLDARLARWQGRGVTLATVRRGRSVGVRARPGGRVVARVGSRTEFGSERVMPVAARRGRFIGVITTARPDGRLGWIDGRSAALSASRTLWSIRADISGRRLEVRHGSRLVARMTVAVGRAGSPTPTGRFAVTDKLDATSYGGTYGCCIIAFSGRQPLLPPGWPGGDRIAVHGTTAEGSVGSAASTGCLRARDRDLKPLMRRLPLGTPVTIRA